MKPGRVQSTDHSGTTKRKPVKWITMKLKGASTVEAVMSMILSGIILSAVSTGFLFIVKSYNSYTSINDSVEEQLLFTTSMNYDFVNSDYIIKNNNSLSFYSSSKNITTYEFIPAAIIKQAESRTDTFHIAYEQFHCYLNGTEIQEPQGLTDAFKLYTEENKPIFFSKVYAMDILVEKEINELNNGI